MSDAPERIWADLNMGIWLGTRQPDRRPAPPTEYIRADIAERDLAEARARISELEIEVNFHAVKKVEAQEAETRLQGLLAEARAIELEHQATIRHLKTERDRRAAEVEHLRKALRDIDRRYINGANADTLVGIARLASATVPGEQP